MSKLKRLSIEGVIEGSTVLTKIDADSDDMSWDEFRMVVLEMIFSLSTFYFKKMKESADHNV